MASSYAPVKMPSSGVSINRSAKAKIPYVYYIGKGYRNAKGQPTSSKILIGRLDEQSGMLIPNNRYFDLYGGSPRACDIEINAIRNFGDFFLVESIIRDFMLDKVLRNVFPGQADEIVLMAVYMALEGNVLYYCDDWCEETLTGRSELLTSQTCSRILKTITEEKRMEFFSAWVNAREQHEYLAYDVTSVSSYGTGNENIEYGYNRDGETLPQINLGMYYGESSMLPIYYCIYPGSINDKSHLKYMMADNERLGISKVKFVMDRGFFSKDNVKFMAAQGYPFILAIPNHLKLAQELIDKHGDTVKSSRYHIEKTGVKAIALENSDYDIRTSIHLFYSAEKAADEDRAFLHKLEVWEQSLLKGEDPQGADKYFVITYYAKDGTRKIERNYDIIDKNTRRMGYFLIMTTDFRKTSGEILNIYRMKDVVEKCFDNLKNNIEMKRLRAHSTETTDGKMFVAFISLILRSHLQNILKDYIMTNNLSIDKILRELRKIKVVKTSSGLLLHNPLTKKQRDILAAFNKSEVEILQRLDTLSVY